MAAMTIHGRVARHGRRDEALGHPHAVQPILPAPTTRPVVRVPDDARLWHSSPKNLYWMEIQDGGASWSWKARLPRPDVPMA